MGGQVVAHARHQLDGDARSAQRNDAVFLAVDDVGDGLPHFFPVKLRNLEVEVDGGSAVGRRADHPDAAAW